MYFETFDATEGSVIFVNPDGKFGLIKVLTPNGTSTPDEQAYYVDLRTGRQPQTALEVKGTALNEHVYFSNQPVTRPLQLGDKILFRTLLAADKENQLSRLRTWCYADTWLDLRHALDEYRFRAPNQAPQNFRNILDLMNELGRGQVIVPKGSRWQKRPSLGPGRHYSAQGTEANVGWRRCSDPRRQLVS